VIAAALDEAMSLAIHGEDIFALTTALEVSFKGPAPIGTFVQVSARITERGGGMISTRAEADVEEGGLRRIAEAAATFVERARPEGDLAGA
jgi:acyl-coenzyme A thioesterase PaaI-like protein